MSVTVGREDHGQFLAVVTLGPVDGEAPLDSVQLKSVGGEPFGRVTTLAVACKLVQHVAAAADAIINQVRF